MPLIFTVPAFLMINPWFAPFKNAISAMNMYFGILMVVAGFLFLIEAFHALPAIKAQRVGLMGAFLMIFLSVINLIIGGLIFSNLYNFGDDTLNHFISYMMGLAIIDYIILDREALFHYRRLKARILGT